MAFLRSASRYNLLVSRKFLSLSSSQHAKKDFQSKLVHAEWLACNRQFGDFRAKSNAIASSSKDIKHSAGSNGTSIASMSTAAAAASPKAASTAAAAAAAAAASRNSNSPPQRDPLDVGFNDPIAAFKSKTTWELVRAYFVYLMCSSEYLVENNMKVKA